MEEIDEPWKGGTETRTAVICAAPSGLNLALRSNPGLRRGGTHYRLFEALLALEFGSATVSAERSCLRLRVHGLKFQLSLARTL
jgi:hypothetical protein